jgi:hypothetical protein
MKYNMSLEDKYLCGCYEKYFCECRKCGILYNKEKEKCPLCNTLTFENNWCDENEGIE